MRLRRRAAAVWPKLGYGCSQGKPFDTPTRFDIEENPGQFPRLRRFIPPGKSFGKVAPHFGVPKGCHPAKNTSSSGNNWHRLHFKDVRQNADNEPAPIRRESRPAAELQIQGGSAALRTGGSLVTTRRVKARQSGTTAVLKEVSDVDLKGYIDFRRRHFVTAGLLPHRVAQIRTGRRPRKCRRHFCARQSTPNATQDVCNIWQKGDCR